MPSIVTLDIYSGRENPSWVVDDDKAADLQRLSRPAAPSPLGPLPILGYRGFQVRPVESQHGGAVRLLGLAEGPHGAVVVGHREAEELLLSTAGEHVDGELKAYVREAIARGPNRAALLGGDAVARGGCPPCHAADAPAYDPAFWNNAQHEWPNNCYNYANNQATDTFAQPGNGTGHPFTFPPTCANVQPAATSDGLRACPDFNGTLGPGQGWYVALVIWPGRDYHWYRQDNVGCWSHKPGHTPVRNVDNSGHAISDPRTCDRGGYTIFCTFMITTRNVHIR